MIMMIQSSKPRKQRLFRATAPMHVRQHFVNAHVSKELSSKLGIKRRTLAVRKGDTVKVMSGDSKGKTGKVADVDLKSGKIRVDGIARKNAKGKESLIPIAASAVYIVDVNTSDKLRQEKLGPKAKAQEQKQQPAPKPQVK